MDIDEIVKQHKNLISTKKSKSFSCIFLEELNDRTNLEVIRCIVFLFPFIAILATIIKAIILCDDICSANCCSECFFCTEEYGIGLFSVLFIIVPFFIYLLGDSTTSIVIADIITLVINLIVLEMYGRNDVITSIAFILYILFLYLMFKRPFLKWYKLNKK